MRRCTICFALLIMITCTCSKVQAGDGRVWVDYVSFDYSEVALQAGQTHIVYLGYDFTALPQGWWLTSNAFEVYSPDGANWIDLVRSDGPLLTALQPTVSKFRRYYTSSDDGVTYAQTADIGSAQPGGNTGPGCRVAASLRLMDPVPGRSGLAGGAGGANGVAVALQFQSLLADTGKTICLDTVDAAGTVAWEWTSGESTDQPVWDNGLGVDGPRCWLIARIIPQGVVWSPPNPANVTFAYCEGGSYYLHAFDPGGDRVTYGFAASNPDGPGSLNPNTGLWTWSGPTVPQGGTEQVKFIAYNEVGEVTIIPFTLNVTITTSECDCCVGRVGDANGSNEDEPTVGDISALIDHLFIGGGQLICIEEADVNQSGGATPFDEDITIGDVSALIDYLFITGAEHGILPNCM